MRRSISFLTSLTLIVSACGGGSSSPPTATHFSVTGPATVAAGTPFNVTVTALDGAGNAVPGYTGTVQLTSVDPQAVLPASAALMQGSGTFAVTLTTLGSITITATDGANGSLSGTSSAITVTAAPASHFAVTGPATAVVTERFTFLVDSRDASNALVAGYSGTLHFTSSDPNAVLPADTHVTSGTLQFQATLTTPGAQTLTVASTGADSITGTSQPISIAPVTPLVITSAAPAGGVAGQSYGGTISTTNYCSLVGGAFTCLPCGPTICSGLPFCPRRGPPHGRCVRTISTSGFQLTADGGVPPYAWSTPAPPPGLTLSGAGVLAGTVPLPGNYPLTVAVKDSNAPSAQQGASYSISIVPPPPPVVDAVTMLPIATLGSRYIGYTFSATNGLTPLSWSESGALPAGMALGADGVLSGTPTGSAGSYAFSLTATDVVAQSSAPVPVTLQVFSHGFTATGSMAAMRVAHTLTLLGTGKVLVVGGVPDDLTQSNALSSAELFDPATGNFTSTGSLLTPRSNHTATLLPSGKVLVAGGQMTNAVGALATTEIYDPVAGTFLAGPTMTAARQGASATLLPGGKVLVAGGDDGNGAAQASAELYDPTTVAFAATGSMTIARATQVATLLKNGTLLITGGYQATAEIYDPATGLFKATGGTGAMAQGHTATLLPNGKVLVAGGLGLDGSSLDTIQVYDAATGIFTASGSLRVARTYHVAALLGDGTVLIAGGTNNATGYLSSAEIFDPASGTLAAAADMTAQRRVAVIAVLPSGQPLVTGGDNGSGELATAETYR